MTADEWDFDVEPPEREHDCCPRCGRGSCPGSGSLGWDGCEDPTWTVTDRTGDAHSVDMPQCHEAQWHGQFPHCSVPGCGWREPTPPSPDAQRRPVAGTS